jgi:heme-degrading monooxygenase HmoA
VIGDDIRVIVRMWETPVKAGQIDALIQYVKAEVWPGVTNAKGFVGGEILRSYGEGGDRLLLVTRWEGAAALGDFLGPDWQAHQMTPVPAEEPLLSGSPFVDHWDLVTTFDPAE